ncbi:Glucans biosynthesis protein D [gamma proteobacterium HdN1]|nr:Glucans biosynthesis protein D [gamma proteobacterium HdN1]
MQRRIFVKSMVLLAAMPAVSQAGFLGSSRSNEAKEHAFDYAWLKGEARTLASQPFQPHTGEVPDVLAALDWDSYQAIRFRPEHALWADEDLPFQIQFFHLGRGFRDPVHMYEVVDGKARPILYDPEMFTYENTGIRPRSLPNDLGFAGFRVQFYTDWVSDVAAFLGASYFRAVGGEKQYGLSARGLAIDCGMSRPEEFPVFRAWWLERPRKGIETLIVHALLDSPSITGAYRFEIHPGATLTMDVDAALYPRKPIERLGIAPITSMYQTGENDRRMANDWRPEIHDSDGLAMYSGNGENLWRPLTNPTSVRVNSYFDENPQGFALEQRDRNFDHYQDDGVFYEKRPHLWVEPKPLSNRGWGKGAVQLVEIPTVDETFDNIVTFWNPAEAPQPGQELLYSYRLYWGEETAPLPSRARVVNTFTGIGGIIGRPRKYFSWRFAVDFVGGVIPMLREGALVEAVVSSSRGEIEIVSARPQREIGGMRAMFDLKLTDETTEPINLRLFLRVKGQVISETWIYQYTPPTLASRKAWLESSRPA